MDENTEGLLASWIGTAMTLLTALTGLAVLLNPERPERRAILWVLFAAFAVGTVLSFLRVFRIHRRARIKALSPAPSEDIRYTSDGLDTRIIGTGSTSGSREVATIIQVRPSGAELPQPLAIRVECSRELDDGYATFYPNAAHFETKKDQRSWRAKINGKIAYFDMPELKLSRHAMLSLNLMWHQGRDNEEITFLVMRREVTSGSGRQ